MLQMECSKSLNELAKEFYVLYPHTFVYGCIVIKQDFLDGNLISFPITQKKQISILEILFFGHNNFPHNSSRQNNFCHWYKFNGKFWSGIDILHDEEIKNYIETHTCIKMMSDKFNFKTSFIKELANFYFVPDLKFNSKHNIYFSNGVFNLMENTLKPHSPTELNDYIIDINYSEQNDFSSINMKSEQNDLVPLNILSDYIKCWVLNKNSFHIIFITRNSNHLLDAIKILFNIRENIVEENSLCLISNSDIMKNIYPFKFYPIFILEYNEVPDEKNSRTILINYSHNITPLELLLSIKLDF